MKIGPFIVCLFFLVGCASGRLDILDTNGKVVGECTAGYNWHFYGASDSVDWLLNYCAQEALKETQENYTVSDESIINKDYTIPAPPTGESWNKLTAWHAFKLTHISEKVYGYILADIENVFYLSNVKAQELLENGDISKAEYNQRIESAKLSFYGE